MVIRNNLEEIQKKDQVIFLDNLNISVENGGFSFLEISNKVMARVYYLFFVSELPRVLDDMKFKVQLKTEPTGDWFLYKDFKVLRIYGFTYAPYKLPSFLTPRIFALEFLRKRLYVEKEHFLKHKKACDIKFNYILQSSTFPESTKRSCMPFFLLLNLFEPSKPPLCKRFLKSYF